MSYLSLDSQHIAQFLAHGKWLTNVGRTDNWTEECDSFKWLRKLKLTQEFQIYKVSQHRKTRECYFQPLCLSFNFSIQIPFRHRHFWLWNITSILATLWHHWISQQDSREPDACRIFLSQFSIKTVGDYHLNNFCFAQIPGPRMSQFQN